MWEFDVVNRQELEPLYKYDYAEKTLACYPTSQIN